MVVPMRGDAATRQRALSVLALLFMAVLVTTQDAGANDIPAVPPDRFGADCTPVALWGAQDYDAAATSLLSDIDLTGDGHPDLVVGVPRAQRAGTLYGAAYVVAAPLATEAHLGDAYAVLQGPTSGSQAGRSIASAGDVNGDGVPDLVIGAPTAQPPGQLRSGAAFVFYGPVAPGTRSMWQADAKLYGGTDQEFGTSVAGVGDVNGDGHDDLLVGAPGVGTRSDRHGAAFLFHGPITGSRHWHEADVALMGVEKNGRAGWAVAAAGDLDGDGHPDVGVSAPHARSARGLVYLLHAAQLGAPSLHLSEAAAVRVGEQTSDNAGLLLVPLGDTDGDGHADLLVGAPKATVGGIRDRGSAYVVRGGTSGEGSLGDAAVRFIGDPLAGRFGDSAALVPDLHGDGRAHLAIAAPDDGAGAIRIYSDVSRLNGTVTADLANETVRGKATGDRFGYALSSGDADQNGRPGLAVGVPGEAGPGIQRGAVRHFDGGDMTDDRDGDRLLDGCETLRYRTDPDVGDTDGDGLYDGEEALIYQTDPNDRDTDGDLHSDLAEVVRHADPLNPFSFPVHHHPVGIPIPPPFEEMPVTDDLEPIY